VSANVYRSNDATSIQLTVDHFQCAGDHPGGDVRADEKVQIGNRRSKLLCGGCAVVYRDLHAEIESASLDVKRTARRVKALQFAAVGVCLAALSGCGGSGAMPPIGASNSHGSAAPASAPSPPGFPATFVIVIPPKP
jgi:hypothetical protein